MYISNRPVRLVRSIALLFLIFAGGCASAGGGFAPMIGEPPVSWRSLNGEGAGAGITDSGSIDPKALSEWWTAFGDHTLSALIAMGIEKNPDIRAARAALREARARRGMAAAGLYPSIGSSAYASYGRGSKGMGGGGASDSYGMRLDASWEADIFGGTRRAVEAEAASLRASEAALQYAHVSLAAEIALDYIELRGLEKRLSIALDSVRAEEEAFANVKAFYDAGLRTELDMQEARYGLDTARAQVPSLRTGVDQARNRLTLLLGGRPGALDDLLSGPSSIPEAPPGMAVGIPADVLRQRPDVRQAESELAARTARSKSARADLYPKLRLSGSVGIEALDAGDVFSSGSDTYGLGANLSWPVFRAGELKLNVEAQGAIEEQALIAYESTVLRALGEVESAISAYSNERARTVHLVNAVDAARKALSLHESLYASGLSDYQGVLISRQSLYSTEDRLAQSTAAVASDMVNLYKALGGGWAKTETGEIAK